MFNHLFGAYNKNLRPEFFPGWLCYLSVKVFGFFKAFGAGSPFRFTATNPGFPLGGLFPSSKRDILKQLPSEYIPDTVFIDTKSFGVESMKKKISESTLTFPMIIKPDNGLRGLGIQIFHTQAELDAKLPKYVEENERRGAWLVQKFIDYPLELGVFYIRKPNEEKGIVTGIVKKEFLGIVGDGESTFQQLVNAHPRAKFHRELLSEQFADQRTTIVKQGESIDIVEIGTHSRGSTFLDASDAVTPELTELFNSLSKSIDGFYYGRYDVRVKSIQGLLDGDFKIMEINPTYGEPTWMYDPDYSFYKQQSILLKHRSLQYDVAVQNHENGVPYATFAEFKEARSGYEKLV